MHTSYIRMLLDPDPAGGGGGSPPPAPAPPGFQQTPAPAPAPTPAPPPAPAPPAITADELTRLRNAEAEAARLRQAETDRATAARQAEIDAAAKKGQWETVLALKDADLTAARKSAADAESRAGKFAITSALAAAMSGFSLRPGWGPKLTKDFQDQFRHFPVADTIEVRHAVTGQTPADWLKAELANPMYDGVKVASTSGGAPALDAYGRPVPAIDPSTPAGRDMGNYLQRRQHEAAAGGGMLGLN